MFQGLFSSRRARKSQTSSAPKSPRGSRRNRTLTAELLEKRAMLSVTPNLGILTLDTSSAGALYSAGSGGIVVTNGDIVVDSASSTGAEHYGAGNVSANNIYLHGNSSTSGTGRFVGNIYTASSPLADPLAALPAPTAPSTTFSNVIVNGTTTTLSPGNYIGGIQVLGNAHVTLLPGLYYLTGGLTVSGGTVTGSGVTIYDASGSTSISGSSNVTLTAPTSGLYQGIVLFQNRTDVRPIVVSGSATATLTGEVYAADSAFELLGSASASIHGNGSTIPGALIVKDVNASSSGSLTVAANAAGLTGDLSIKKTDNFGGSSVSSAIGLPTAGGAIVYTITVANAGPSAAIGATMSDALPASFTADAYTVATTGGALDLTHASGSGAIADSVYLPTGSTITYTVTATISSSATGLITNAATVTAPSGYTDTNSADNTASDTDSLYKADLAITDTDNATSAVPGTQDTYTIVVTNNGTAAVTGATVKDLLAANTDITSDTFTVATTSGAADSTNASTGSGSINDSVNMPAGSTITYTVTANIGAGTTGSLTNTATVTTPANAADPVPANNSAADTDTLTPQSNLTVTDADNDSGTVVPGSQVTYTVTVKNCGPSNIVGATVADALPAGVTSDTFTASGTTGASGFSASGSGGIDDTSVNLAAGSSVTYTIVANVGAADTGTLSDTATAKVGTGETNTNAGESAGITSATDTATLSPQVDLVITKTDNDAGNVVPGTAVTYTIAVKNTGPSNAVGVAVADALPAGITSDTYTAVGTTGASGFTASGSGNISDSAVNLASGACITYTITANVSAAATGSLSNTATAKAGAGETNTNAGESGGITSATDTDTLTPKVDLVVTNTDNDSGSVVPGTAVTYTITVKNTGPSNAVGVTVADALPAGITSDSYTAVGTTGASGFTASGTGNISDASVNLAVGSSVTYTVIASDSAAATGSLSNTATAKAGAGETNVNPNQLSGITSATDTDTQNPQVDLTVTTTDNLSGLLVPGQPVTYTVTVANTGPSNAVGVAIADALPAGITSDTYTAVGTSGASGFTASGSGNISDASVNLTAGSTITYTVVANISAAATGTLGNTATATAGTGETNTNLAESGGVTSGTDSHTLTPLEGLVVVVSDNAGGNTIGGTEGNVVPGNTVTYTITVQNSGPSNAVGVTIADALPARIASDTYTATGATGASGFTASGSGNIDDTSVNLAAGSSITYTVVANVGAGATGSLSNSATAAVGTGKTNTFPTEIGGTTTATDVDALTPKVDLVVTNTDNDSGAVTPGSTVTYTIAIKNTGPSNAVGVAIADALPAGVTSDSYTAVGTTGASGFTASGSGNISDASADLAAGSCITYTVMANVSAAVTGTLSNTATAAAGTGETNTNPGESGGTTSTTDAATLTPQVDLVVTKADNDSGVVVPGNGITYTITVQNTGPSNAAGVTIADALPAGISSDTYTAVGTSGATGFTASGSGNIDDTAVNLTAGSSVTYTVVANVSSAATGTLSNTATAKAGTGETNSNPSESGGITSATDMDTLSPKIDLVVTKTENDGASVVPGGAITYTITVTDAGPSNAVGATVADALPAGIASDTYTAVGTTGASGFTASGSGNIDDTSVNLAAGSSVTYTVIANVSSAATGTISNTATAKVAAGETNTYPGESGGTTSATDSESLTPQIDLVVTNTDNGGGNVVPGGSVVYTITISNTGPSNAVGATVADILPAAITSDTYTAIGATGASGFTASGSGNIDDTSINLAAGSSITYTVTANVLATSTGTMSNTATATVGTGETNTNAGQSGGATSATDTDALTPQVDLVVTNIDNDSGSVVPGESVTYTMTVKNTGPSKAVGVSIADSLPAGITSDTYTATATTGASGFTASGSGMIADLSVNLAVGSSITYTVTGHVSAASTGTLGNTATATAGSGETNINAGESAGTTSATDSDALTPLVDLVVTQIDSSGGDIVPGTQIVYVISVTNAGPSNAVGLTLADALPAGIASDTYTASGTTGASGFTASGSGSIDDTSVSLAAGSSITYRVNANVGPAATGTLSNTAAATAGTGETNIFPNELAGTTSATDSESLAPQVDLTVVKSDDGGGSSAGAGTTGSVVPGDTVTYTITVANTGPSSAVGVVIADPLGANADLSGDTFTAVGTTGASGFTASGSGSIDDASVNLAVGSSITYTVTATVSAAATGSLSSAASATAGAGETNTNPNQTAGTTSATDNDALAPQVDLVVTKADDGGGSSAGAGTIGNVLAGGTVTYTITVQNTGLSNAVGVAVADSLPAGIDSDTFTAVGTAGASGFTASGTGNISDATVNLAAGSSITYTVIANVDSLASGTLSNTATAAAGSGETNINPSQSGGITSATDSDLLS